MEAVWEAWDGPYSYLYGDLCHALEKECWDPSLVGHEKARQMFYDWLSDASCDYPYLETASDLVVPGWSDYVEFVIEHAFEEPMGLS
jgi:hypothetical protein